jgi:uncharacterized heparinase superfamily protein
MFEKTQKNNNSEKGCQNAQKIVKYWLRMFTNTKIEIWQYILDWWKPRLTKKI